MSNNPWELPPPEQNNSDAWTLPPNAESENRPGPAVPESSQFDPLRFQLASSKPSSGKKKFNFNGKVLAIVAVIVVVIAGGTTAYFVTGGGKSLAAMSYISSEDPGPDPFMDSTVNTDAAPSSDNPYLVNTSPQGAVAGSDPNIYGGTGELSVCDAAALVSNLQNNSDLNAAFAEGIGINAADVPRYVTSLTPVVLRQDTWVTNHGYDNGHAVPFQAVLQRGTAVMVDAYGAPRVRCSCGNPLAEAWNGYTAPETAKANWDGYDPRTVVTIYQTDVTINTFNVINVDDGISNEISITNDDSVTQQQVLDAVTENTPVTTPKDMGVRPDGKLLGEMGLSEADGDSEERPTGGDRFSDYQQWVETGFGGAKEDNANGSNSTTDVEGTTPVDPAEFEQRVGPEFLGNYYIEIENRGVGCFINTETNGIFCYVDSLAESGQQGPIVNFDGGSSNSHGALNFLVFGGPPGGFTASALMLESPLHGINPDRRLRPGESVTIGDYTCFNLENTMGCTAPVTRFDMDPNGDVYVDRGEVPVNRK
ncbi:MAG: hypothetical protein Q4E11_02565 [Corynebacterium sp.]|uniref:DUF6777 domain-containing protein n=1 Tax=Corynebacterium sp. TaxID=1720 RepID=UPI0026DB8433|nr:DUF6777 domain-containing protein [Corynebacterium sp.]MDO5029450.1 hypothetical protein [Corynebacterium sp.]